MSKPELLEILCCPETHQKLRFAESPLVEKLNRQIASGVLKTCDGKAVSAAIDGGLVREDGKCLYPIRNNIPVMILDEAIALES